MGSGSPSIARIIPPLSTQGLASKVVARQNIHHVVLGNILFKTWYPSYYPEEIVGKGVERLHVCQWCFKYSKEIMSYICHLVWSVRRWRIGSC